MIPPLRTGLVLGKLLPPHLGHLYLVGCALRQVERLFVVVEHIEGEPIPSELRVGWMRQLVPEATIVHLDRAMPQEPGEHPRFWALWRSALLDLLPEPPEVVFASEHYGHRLAAELGARFLPVDPARQVVPISGTAVRADPIASAQYLPDPVRAHYDLPPGAPRPTPLRVALVGPESTGKSTIARALAARFGAYVVPEHAETMIAARVADPQALTKRDFEDFARGRRASEETLARFGGALLVCDSDALTTQLYAERFLGASPAWIADEAATSEYDLTLLFAPDVPWTDDHHRVDREGRDAFFSRMEALLRAHGRAPVVLRGDWRAREEAAIAACARLLGR
ncbi:MAG: AAA family ATPase [Myxococcales bacterium]|nr:AAA family ATPase [Myxococcales bacterium]